MTKAEQRVSIEKLFKDFDDRNKNLSSEGQLLKDLVLRAIGIILSPYPGRDYPRPSSKDIPPLPKDDPPPSIPEPPVPEIQIGDIVEMVNGDPKVRNGNQGVVVVYSKQEQEEQDGNAHYRGVGVDWFDDVGGHDCGGLAHEGHGWFVKRGEARLVWRTP